jgi:hypothetical protein
MVSLELKDYSSLFLIEQYFDPLAAFQPKRFSHVAWNRDHKIPRPPSLNLDECDFLFQRLSPTTMLNHNSFKP